MNNKANRLIEFDYIRVLGTILVVIGHSGYTNMITDHGGIFVASDYARIQRVLLLLIRLIYSFHMPLFFFLSGALFEYSYCTGKWDKFIDLIKIKVKKLIIPFFVVGIIYAIPLKFIAGYFADSKNVFYDAIIGQLFLLDNNYLWFLLSLFWCFIISWIARKMIKKRMIIVILSLIILIIGIQFSGNLLGIIRAFQNYIWFELGGVILANRSKISAVMNRNINGIVLLLVTVGIYCIYIKIFKDNPYFYRLLALFSIACVYFLVTKYKSTKLNKGFLLVLKYSLPIYLFSDSWNYIILMLIKKFNLADLYMADAFCIFIFVFRIVFTIAVSIFIQFLINKAKLVVKFAR